MDRGGREGGERKGIAIAKIISKNNSFLHVDNLELRIIDEVSASLQLLSLPPPVSLRLLMVIVVVHWAMMMKTS
jgi:hypothetical protein